MNHINEKKICFIMCTNNDLYCKECQNYINKLKVPEGYEVEILTVEGADSMTSGYNSAMRESDAKYKIYLHQDVFIVQSDFIERILRLFKNKEIGMIGMVGVERLPECYIPWYGNRCGKLYSCNAYEVIKSDFDFPVKGWKEVEAIDGLLMATQYDIEWREDLLKGWDFYDVSQSKEFQHAGYKVVVPEMKNPWCIHDDGILNLSQYYNSRRVFMKEYQR